ncbi:NifU family protein [Breoghania sp. JC706]|uniref:NifU family protein n=1 Tax=Breoghania sp. JC706 TaxID=3117732 RepID=UPI0030085025
MQSPLVQISQMTSEAPHDASDGREAERLAVINRVLDEVRPNLQRDGGDCVLVKVEGKRVLVRLSGACVMCKLASMTLEGIQSRMVEELGEFVRLVPVMGGVPA